MLRTERSLKRAAEGAVRTIRAMNKATFHSLTAAEQSLVLETERPRLLEHDEAALIEVLQRVSKQRAKAVSPVPAAARRRGWRRRALVASNGSVVHLVPR